MQKRVPASYLGCVSGLIKSDKEVDDGFGVARIHTLDGLFIQKIDNQRVKDHGMAAVKTVAITDGLSNTVAVSEAVPETLPGLILENQAINQGRKDHWSVGSDDVDTTGKGDISEFLGSTGVGINLTKVPPGSPAFAAYEIGYSSRHPNGINVLFADGSVRNVRQTIDALVWRAYGTRARGDSISE